jgi:cell division protein FtsL
MSTVAESPPVSRRNRRTSPAKGSGARRRPLLLGGVFWIVAFGLLFAGVVALNVIVLRLTVELDGLGRERAELKADLARLQSQLSTASSNIRIGQEARDQLGLVAADPATTTYVRLGPEDK